ncbi:MAG: hypothetical protein K9L30_14575 [Desulfobacterales bacterium]|nr:hypothetical protein [Desulfobacterales bacterium]
MTKVLFTTDIHGSEICFKKFIASAKFYKANVLIMGGDCTGKMIVPLVQKNNSEFSTNYLGNQLDLSGSELSEFERKVKNAGYYPVRLTEDEVLELESDENKVHSFFLKTMANTLVEWLEYAEDKLNGVDVKCILTPGNDDHFEIDEVLKQNSFIVDGEEKAIWIDDHHEMISLGWSNPTPWNTPRECSEEDLYNKIEALVGGLKNINNSIFNLHAPPHGSGLDVAPEMDDNMSPKRGGTVMAPVGSKAVKKIILKYQPLLGLHGHIHESKGVQKLGKTLCINPGSTYGDGSLSGVLFDLSKNKVKSYMLTVG